MNNFFSKLINQPRLNISILTYHRVLPETSLDRSPFTVSAKQFEEQMTFLSENGYRALTLSQLLDRLNATNEKNGIVHPGEVVLTFDDGYTDNYETAFPILRAFGLSATFFVITGRIGTADFMSWQQLAEMQRGNMHIESHGHSHTPLELLSVEEIITEVTHSKAVIEQRLDKTVRFMSFPHGSYNKAALDTAREAGYQACATSKCDSVQRSSDAFELPRILIRKSHTIAQFASLSRGEGLTFFKAKMLHRSKNSIKNLVGLQRYQNLHNLRYRIQRHNVYNQDESV